MVDLITPNEYAAGGPFEQLNSALGSVAGINTVSSDPGVGQDNTQGYVVGSMVFNNTAGILRLWKCRDITTNAAKWILCGVDYVNGGTNPAAEVTQFGLGAALMAEEGNISRQLSSAGIQPGATGADNVLAFFSLPANSFDIAGRGVTITAQGTFVSNANTKDMKIVFNPSTAVVGSTVGAGGTTIADTGSQTTGTAGTGWSIQANVFKYGAAASNTQLGLHQQAQVGSVVGGIVPPSLLTATESGAILIAVTGNAGTAATDIKLNFFEINAMN